MAITRAEVQHVALLARLGLSEAEVERLAEEMSAIIGYIDKLNELDTDNVQPSAAAVITERELRPDQSRPSLPLDAVLANAPQQEGEYFRFGSIMAAIREQGQSTDESEAAAEFVDGDLLAAE